MHTENAKALRQQELLSLRAVIICLLLMDAVLASAFLADQLIGTPFGYVTHQINLNGEGNFAAWYSSAKLLGVSVLLAITSRMRILVGDVRGWLLFAVALGFAILSADEVAQVHEWLGERSDALLQDGTREATFFDHTGIWMFVLGIPFIVILLGALYALRNLFAIEPGSLAMFCAGAFTWLLGALGVEIFQNIPDRGSWGFVISILVEESLEMLGVTFMFASGYALARRASSEFFLKSQA